MRDGLARAGAYLIPSGCVENGFKHITSVSKPIRAQPSISKASACARAAANCLSSSTRQEPADRWPQPASRRRGPSDGQENPLVVAEENRLYEVCKYLSLTSHQWAGYNMIANNDFWQQLPTQIQEIVIRNTKTYVAQQRAFVRTANANLEQTLRGRGMLIHTVDIESVRERLRVANFYRNWRQSASEEARAPMEAKVGKVG
jgi:TRAP-type transport system periplasmic protein